MSCLSGGADEQLEAALVPASGERDRRPGRRLDPSGRGHGFVAWFGVWVNIWLSFRGQLGRPDRRSCARSKECGHPASRGTAARTTKGRSRRPFGRCGCPGGYGQVDTRVTVFEITGMPGIVGVLSESAVMPVAVADHTFPATQGAAKLPNGWPLTTPLTATTRASNLISVPFFSNEVVANVVGARPKPFVLT